MPLRPAAPRISGKTTPGGVPFELLFCVHAFQASHYNIQFKMHIFQEGEKDQVLNIYFNNFFNAPFSQKLECSKRGSSSADNVSCG